jgi:hypothetical protein
MSRTVDRAAAETFIWRTARLLERHRYAYHFRGSDPAPVLAALLAYRNPDGGFGSALEPDFRGPDSQPALAFVALQVLDEIGQCRGELARPVCDYLTSVTAPDGGVPPVLPSARSYPMAPFFEVGEAAAPGGLLPTAGIAGLLHKNRVEHPWLDAATDFCWQAIAALADTHPYEAEYALTFLDHVPDRARATREADRLGRLVRERKMVVLDPDRPEEAQVSPGYAPGEVHTPLDYASRPESLARGWFSDAEIARHLDALAATQADDGGWHINWREWNPATTLESRGLLTLEILLRLRAYGRLA